MNVTLSCSHRVLVSGWSAPDISLTRSRLVKRESMAGTWRELGGKLLGSCCDWFPIQEYLKVAPLLLSHCIPKAKNFFFNTVLVEKCRPHSGEAHTGYVE